MDSHHRNVHCTGSGERDRWEDLHIPRRMLQALNKFNPTAPAQYLKQALAEMLSPKSNDAISENQRFHSYLGLVYIDAEVASLCGLLAGYDWRTVLAAGGPKAWLNATTGTVNYSRSPSTPGNQVEEGETTLAGQYRLQSGQLARAWALCSAAETVLELQPDVQFLEEVRVWMAKYDAEERIVDGRPVPEEIQRLLANLIATSTAAGDVLDIYEAAGMPKPTLSDLSPEFATKTQDSRNPHLAIEALRKLINQESAKSTRNNVIRQRAFSDRVLELMKKYTNQQLTSAEVIAELVALAKEVAAEASRGATFTPPFNEDELAFFDAVAENESAVSNRVRVSSPISPANLSR